MTPERRADYDLRGCLAVLVDSVRDAAKAGVPRDLIRARLRRCKDQIDDLTLEVEDTA
jgi:hypothetical protein